MQFLFFSHTKCNSKLHCCIYFENLPRFYRVHFTPLSVFTNCQNDGIINVCRKASSQKPRRQISTTEGYFRQYRTTYDRQNCLHKFRHTPTSDKISDSASAPSELCGIALIFYATRGVLCLFLLMKITPYRSGVGRSSTVFGMRRGRREPLFC